MKIKKSFLSIAFMAAFMLTATSSRAQSWADLLNKDSISKVVNAITGPPPIVRYDRNMEL